MTGINEVAKEIHEIAVEHGAAARNVKRPPSGCNPIYI